MSTSIADVQLPASTWIEIYAATGIAVGTPLIIQNKVTAAVTTQIRSTIPTSTSDGYLMYASATNYFNGTLPGIWVRCTTAGRLVVMIDDSGAA